MDQLVGRQLRHRLSLIIAELEPQLRDALIRRDVLQATVAHRHGVVPHIASTIPSTVDAMAAMRAGRGPAGKIAVIVDLVAADS